MMNWLQARLGGHKPEKRESAPFTDALLDAFAAAAAGQTSSDARATAALESASVLWGNCFAAARVEPTNRRTAALTPNALKLIGRQLIRYGESIHLVRVKGGRVELVPAGSWDIRGTRLEAGWYYRLDLFGPSGNRTSYVPGARVIHTRWAVEPSRPWHGLSTARMGERNRRTGGQYRSQASGRA